MSKKPWLWLVAVVVAGLIYGLLELREPANDAGNAARPSAKEQADGDPVDPREADNAEGGGGNDPAAE